MSVVVRIEMPKGCWDCPCVNGDYGYCQADKEERQIEDPNERASWCPILCQLPEGHGRLADKDLLMRDLDFLNTFGTPDDGKELSYEDILVTIDDFPTIVPAEAERSEP
jgi:hypothetical protein